MSRTLCLVEAPYVGPMVNAHTHRCNLVTPASALGNTHQGPHQCETCGHHWMTTVDEPVRLLLCGAVGESHLVPPPADHPHHTCNVRVQDENTTHIGMHHCNCGTQWTVPPPTIIKATDVNGARCNRCHRWREMRFLAYIGANGVVCHDSTACNAYQQQAQKGGTPRDGNAEREGTDRKSVV